MTVTVAMYEKSWQHIHERLDALDLDLRVWTFDGKGVFTSGDERVAAQDLDVDFFWLSSHVVRDDFRDRAFEIVLSCKSINVLQTFNAGLDDPVYRKLADRGTRIVNSSAQGIAIAEYVLAQVLNVMHPIALQREQQAQRRWALTPFKELSRTRWVFSPTARLSPMR